MNPHLASSLALVAAAAAAALLVASGNAYADDITLDNTPFMSKASRSDVTSDLYKRPGPSPLTEWSTQQSEPVQGTSSYTPSQARGDYIRSRGVVSSLTSEDSGSSYFKMARPRPDTATMGAPAN
jgi:hypothetical protein